MTQEQIEQAANKYAATDWKSVDDSAPIIDEKIKAAFLAGAALTAPGDEEKMATYLRGLMDGMSEANGPDTNECTCRYDQKQRALCPVCDREKYAMAMKNDLTELKSEKRSASQPGVDCTHEPLVDTGVGYYHCPSCKQGWTYAEWKAAKSQSPSLPPDGVQGLVEALEKIVALQISGKVNERVHRIAREAPTALESYASLYRHLGLKGEQAVLKLIEQ